MFRETLLLSNVYHNFLAQGESSTISFNINPSLLFQLAKKFCAMDIHNLALVYLVLVVNHIASQGWNYQLSPQM